MEQKKENEEQNRCELCFLEANKLYRACKCDCGRTLAERKKEIEEAKALQK